MFAGPQFGFNVGDKEHKITDHETWHLSGSTLSVNLGVGVMLINHIQLSANYNIVCGKTGEITTPIDVAKTGIKNKGALTREINEFLADHTTNKGMLFIMDVDKFKSINDTLGHDIGDSVIKQIGAFLGEKFNDGNIAGRFGGDEFIVFIKDSNDAELASRTADEIVKGVYDTVFLPDHERKVSVSVGVARYFGLEKNYSELLKKADTALYRAKGDSNKRFYIYE